MTGVRYKIPMLSAKAILAYAKPVGEDIYSFNLNKAETASVLLNHGETYQDDNAVFYQLMSMLHRDGYSPKDDELIIEDLYDAIIYLDFAGIFDRSAEYPKNALRQKKAESMYRPEGITLDLGGGQHKYLAFERSASMSRNAKLSFVRADLYDEITRRITLNLKIDVCELSKLYAYNGLLFSSGIRVEPDNKFFLENVAIVPNPKHITNDVSYVTVTDVTGEGSVRKYERTECTGDIETTRFDGMGLISPEFAREIDIKIGSKKEHSSFQIRMPYIKGMVHKTDFKALFKEAGVETITDIWGRKHNVNSLCMILTESQFKGCKWLKQYNVSWQTYVQLCRAYEHTLYITNVSKTESEDTTELNYQFLNTVKMLSSEFRPDDLPLGWEHSPAEDKRMWLTKPTEQRYYDLRSDTNARIRYFTDKADEWTFGRKSRSYHLAELLKKNPKFINEPYFVRQLDDAAESLLKDYSIGRLLVDGDNRFFAADIMELFYELIRDNGGRPDIYFSIKNEFLDTNEFYAPGAVYSEQDIYALLRNPHIARNEEALVKPLKKIGAYREKYLSSLKDVIMVNSVSLLAERLGGADFDGDMIKTVAEPKLTSCIMSNYSEDDLSQNGNLPLLSIPSAKPIIADANDWYKRFETIRNTFSSRVGQISNAALDRSIIAYDENTDDEKKEQYRKETEVLEILTGLEIDSAKSGIKPDLTEYLETNKAERTSFLKYKTLIEKAEGKRRWYEPTFDERFKKFFDGQNWDEVSSNLEKLPYFARELKKHTPRADCHHADASELFTFAKPGWEKKLDPKILAYVSRVISDYEKCLTRIRARRKAASNIKAKHNDINRILYMQNKENDYEADELAAVFINLPEERVNEIYLAVRTENWHFMKENERYAFLIKYLPETEYREYYDIFADFRFGGYKLLPDIITETRNYNISANASAMQYPNDSEELTLMVKAYLRNPVGNYRETVSKEAARIIETHVISFNASVKYIVALGKRDFLYDAYYRHINRFARKGEKIYD